MRLRELPSAVCDLLTGSRYGAVVALLLWLVDLAFSVAIVFKVPYTEIDWKAYMEQVALYIDGERDYTKIKGGTGPLVYPAGHVYIYSLLYKLTDNGENIFRAQMIFTGLYLATLALVFRSYIKAKAPLYAFPLVILSKRLHSIYMLRLFNDGFAIFVTYVAISVWQNQYWLLGAMIFSFGVSIKMNVLLFLPAVGVIMLQALGPKVFRAALYMLQVQIIVAYPFSSKFFLSYVTRAFQFNRVFLYKWTVNWRFIEEAVFLTPEFAQTLLLIHVVLLLGFIFTRWIKPSNMNLINIIQTLVFPTPRPIAVEHAIFAKMSPDFILKTLYTCNLIGVLCARSLHYQFYSWFAWSLPYLLSVTGWHPVVQYGIWLAEEWAWNVFPSTRLSSLVVVGTNAAIIIGVWFGTKKDALAQKGVAGAPVVPPEMSSISIKESPAPIISAPVSASTGTSHSASPSGNNPGMTKASMRDQKRRRASGR
ncbi:ALG3 protein-domain-containing protein [Myxozyma melibiosi]|uniref:Dol-P-Man:Man(5)GlcNAc(2)-PP-Dol alpha-1,3-mannosyltransferase n=1 Tax=Myxozyma melibiosi TaxID=54550 RepID=A0ABR1F8W4_9ASCO